MTWTSPARAWMPWLALAAALLIALLVYWPGLAGGFVLDDQQNIVRNAALHVQTLHLNDWMAATFSSPASDLQRPLAMLTLAANHYFTGLDPAPMKFTNLLLHVFNGMLVFGMVRVLLGLAAPGRSPSRRDWASSFVAAGWILHPIQLTAVLYVVQRMESLSHTFVLAGLWLYLAGRQRQLAGQRGWPLLLAGIAGGTALGLMAKESAALLPLYAFCVELVVLRFRGAGGTAQRGLHWLFAATLWLPAMAGLTWLWPRFATGQAFALRDFTLIERLLTESRIVVDYMTWIVLPDLSRLSLFHDDYPISHGLLQPPGTIVALALLTAMLVVAAWVAPRRPVISLGILFFLCAHLLTATALPLELVYEHRNYFALLGACLIATDLLFLLPNRPGTHRIAGAAALLMVAYLSWLTALRALEWRDPQVLYRTEARRQPKSPRAQYEYARMLIGQVRGPSDPRLEQAWRALERSRDTPGSGVLPHYAALVLAAQTATLNRHAGWWEALRDRLATQPFDAEQQAALVGLTNCAADGRCRFPPGEMLSTYGAAMGSPPRPVVLELYGKYAMHVLGDYDLTLRLWRQASQADPGDVHFRYNLARLLAELGLHAEARSEVAELRRRGRFGQNDALALDVEQRLAADARSRREPRPPPRP